MKFDNFRKNVTYFCLNLEAKPDLWVILEENYKILQLIGEFITYFQNQIKNTGIVFNWFARLGGAAGVTACSSPDAVYCEGSGSILLSNQRRKRESVDRVCRKQCGRLGDHKGTIWRITQRLPCHDTLADRNSKFSNFNYGSWNILWDDAIETIKGSGM